MMKGKRVLVAAVSGALCLAGLVAPPGIASAEDSDTCQQKPLQVPDTTAASGVQVGSPDGSVLAGTFRPDGGDEIPVVWRDGAYEQLDLGFALEQFYLVAANDSGAVAGQGRNRDAGTNVSFIHKDGQTTLLDDPDGVVPDVADMNAEGDAVGYDDGRGVALRWDADSPDQVEELPAPGPAAALAISDDGTIVGYLGWAIEPLQPYIWRPDGSHGPLPEPDGVERSWGSVIRGDQVGGNVEIETSEFEDRQGMHWNLAAGTVRQFPESIEVRDVNPAGELVVSQRGVSVPRATVIRGEQVIELPSVGYSRAMTISDAGVVAGSADNADGVTQAVTWSGC